MSDKRFKRFEFAAPFAVFLLASLLHFIYDLVPSVLTALLGAVNESIWEHMKIFSIAFVFYGVVEYLWLRPELKRFVAAKVAGLFVQLAVIPLVYYGYTLFAKGPVLWVDLIIGFMAAVLGTVVSSRLYKGDREIEKYFYTALLMLCLLLIMILCFTYFPPETELFRDVVTGTYGITSEELDMGAFAMEKTRSTDIF